MTSKSAIAWMAVLFITGILGAQACGGSKKGGADPDAASGAGVIDPGTGGAVGPSGGIAGAAGAAGAGGLTAAGGDLGTGGSTANACGDPGTSCCEGNSCKAGGCCVSGICMASGGTCVGLGGGVCSNGVCGNCGGPGLPCCNSGLGPVCTSVGTTCSGGTCAKCGDQGTACCASATGVGTCQDAGLMCNSGLCQKCGVPGGPCCAGNTCQSGCCYGGTCIGEATSCGAGNGTCSAGRCTGCGSATQPCCGNICYDKLLCLGNTCGSCGGPGETCCPAGGITPQCQTGLACNGAGAAAVCARCGTLGDACCPGSICNEGCCSAGRCVAGSCPAGTGGSTATGGATGVGGTIATGGSVVGGTTRSGSTVIAGTTGIGGTSALGGTTGTGGTTVVNTATGGACGLVIDNMEAGTGKICQGNGRNGFWFTYADTGLTSAISPAPGTMAPPVFMSVARTTDSTYAMHISGTYSNYAGIGCYLNRPSLTSTTGSYDASAYKGITFWAKGTGNGGNFITAGQMASTELAKWGGTCLLSACDGNTFALKGLSSTVWTQYTVPFTALTGGTVSPFDPQGTWTFEFQFNSTISLAGAPFDLWIDDLSFY